MGKNIHVYLSKLFLAIKVLIHFTGVLHVQSVLIQVVDS